MEDFLYTPVERELYIQLSGFLGVCKAQDSISTPGEKGFIIDGKILFGIIVPEVWRMEEEAEERGKRKWFYLLTHRRKEEQTVTTHGPFLKSCRLNKSLSKICISVSLLLCYLCYLIPSLPLLILLRLTHSGFLPPYSCKLFALEERQRLSVVFEAIALGLLISPRFQFYLPAVWLCLARTKLSQL